MAHPQFLCAQRDTSAGQSQWRISRCSCRAADPSLQWARSHRVSPSSLFPRPGISRRGHSCLASLSRRPASHHSPDECAGTVSGVPAIRFANRSLPLKAGARQRRCMRQPEQALRHPDASPFQPEPWFGRHSGSQNSRRARVDVLDHPPTRSNPVVRFRRTQTNSWSISGLRQQPHVADTDWTLRQVTPKY